MVDRIFKIILLFTPIAYCVGVAPYRFGIIFFQIASIILFMAAMLDTPKREFNIRKLTVLFLGVCLFSVAANKFNLKSVVALSNVLFACLDVYILAVYSEDLKKCMNWLMIGLGINTLIFIGQLFGYSPFIDLKTLRGNSGPVSEYGGIIGNAPIFAAFIALTLPFVKRIYLIPALIIGVLLKEASVFVSIFAVCFYESLRRIFSKKDTVIIAVILSIALISIFHKSILQSFSIRFVVWKEIINHIAQRPLYGIGLGNFGIADYGMSSFLQWILGVGILGLGFIYICLKRFVWYLAPLLFLCMVEYPFEIPRLYPVIIFTIAYFAIEQKEDKLC